MTLVEILFGRAAGKLLFIWRNGHDPDRPATEQAIQRIRRENELRRLNGDWPNEHADG